MSTNPVRAFVAAALLVLALSGPGRSAPEILGANPIRQQGGEPSVVQYDLAGCLAGNPNIAYFITTTPSFQLPLILDQPTGSFGSISWMAYEMTASMGSVGFSGSQTTGSYPLTFGSGTPTEFYPGWLGLKGLTYLVLPNNLQVGPILQVTPTLVQEVPGRGGITCPLTLVCALAVLMGADPAGPCGGLRGGNWIAVCQRYRDEVLAGTSTGQYYIDLYDQYSLDMARAWVAQPCLVASTLAARDPWITALQALLDGAGDGAMVTQDMQDDLNGICDAFENTRGGLAAVVATERQKLQLDAIAGLTLTEFQTQIETLGGPSAVEPESWGRVKSLYR